MATTTSADDTGRGRGFAARERIRVGTLRKRRGSACAQNRLRGGRGRVVRSRRRRTPADEWVRGGGGHAGRRRGPGGRSSRCGNGPPALLERRDSSRRAGAPGAQRSRGPSGRRRQPTIWGANMSFRREVSEVGGFERAPDERDEALPRRERELIGGARRRMRAPTTPRGRADGRAERLRVGLLLAHYFQRAEGGAADRARSAGQAGVPGCGGGRRGVSGCASPSRQRRPDALACWLDRCAAAGRARGFRKRGRA